MSEKLSALSDHAKARLGDALVSGTIAYGENPEVAEREAQRGIGDVLLAWENEAFLALSQLGADQFEIVVPSLSILAEPPVAIVDRNVDRRGTRKAAEAYLAFLYSAAGQRLAAKHYYRPREPQHADAADIARFPKLELVTIEGEFGSWAEAQATHFADGGIFDQVSLPQ